MIQEKQNQKVKVYYSVMSNKKCKECGEPIKQNVVNNNPHACLCYVCFKLSQGKKEASKHRVINDEKIFIKRRDFIQEQKKNRRKNGWSNRNKN